MRDRLNDLLNVVDWIGYTSILGYALITEVKLTIFCYSDVL